MRNAANTMIWLSPSTTIRKPSARNTHPARLRGCRETITLPVPIHSRLTSRTMPAPGELAVVVSC